MRNGIAGVGAPAQALAESGLGGLDCLVHGAVVLLPRARGCGGRGADLELVGRVHMEHIDGRLEVLGERDRLPEGRNRGRRAIHRHEDLLDVAHAWCSTAIVMPRGHGGRRDSAWGLDSVPGGATEREVGQRALAPSTCLTSSF